MKNNKKTKFGKYNAFNNFCEIEFDYNELKFHKINEKINIPLDDENTEYRTIEIVYKDNNGIGITIYNNKNDKADNEPNEIFEFVTSDSIKDYRVKTLNNKAVPIALTIHYFDKHVGLLKMPVSYFQLKDNEIGTEFRIHPVSTKEKTSEYYESFVKIVHKSDKGCLIQITHLEKESGPNSKEIYYQWYDFI